MFKSQIQKLLLLFCLCFSASPAFAEQMHDKSDSKIVSDFLSANGNKIQQETNLVYYCSYEKEYNRSKICSEVTIILNDISRDTENIEFIPINDVVPEVLNFLFVSTDPPEIEEKILQVAKSSEKTKLAEGCEAFLFLLGGQKYVIFLLRENVDLRSCVMKSTLYYLGYRGLSKLKTDRSVNQVFGHIFKR